MEPHSKLKFNTFCTVPFFLFPLPIVQILNLRISLICFASDWTINLLEIKQYPMSKIDKLAPIRRKLNHYSYLQGDSIGKGYSSEVFRGRDDLTDQEVAIKLIDMKHVKGDIHKALLANELEILNLLKHTPNVIDLFDIYTNKQQTCIVTELCEGGDLSKKIKSQKVVTQKEAVHILKQIINGYRSLYRYGIIHRDLKPANVFFSQGGVKIADLGFAIKANDLKKSSNYNVGSPVYMPLEALNDNNYSYKSDIWAIGVIFFEMLTGKTPWKAKTESDLKRQLKAVPIKNLIPIQITKTATQFLLKALQINPQLRMTPEEMDTYSTRDFESSGSHNLNDTLINKNLFVSTKKTNFFKTRAISQQKQERAEPFLGKKNDLEIPRTLRKLTALKLGEDYPSENLTKTASIACHQPIEVDNKKLGDQLVSQIHYCRFTYKLIERIRTIFPHSSLSRMLMKNILRKLENIKDLIQISPKHLPIFIRSKHYQNVLSIVQQYKTRYTKQWEQQQLQATQPSEVVMDQMVSQLLSKIKQLYQMIRNGSIEVQQMTDEIILLDYLITLKQLIKLNEGVTLQEFHEKANMEAIVQGRPTKNITRNHIQAITDKLRLSRFYDTAEGELN